MKSICPYLAQTDNGDWPASQDEIEQATEFTTNLLQDKSVDMPPAFVIDVGKISGRGWAVVEVNPAWASGVYGSDPIYVLNAPVSNKIIYLKLTNAGSGSG